MPLRHPKKNGDKINILHLRDSPWVCGPGRTILETGSLIDDQRFNYIIGAFAGQKGKKSPLIDAAVERKLSVFPIKERKPFDFQIFRQVLDFIDNYHIDILHTHEFRSDLIGLICAKIKKIIAVTTLHGWITNSIKGKLFVTADKILLPGFDRIICVSERIKNQVLKIGISRDKVVVLQNAIRTEKFIKDENDRSFKKVLGLNSGVKLIGNIGRLSPEKGQTDFILAAQQIIQRFSNIRFVLVGIGPDQSRLETLIHKLGLGPFFIFTGFRTDMTRIYNSLDLVVQTSYTEGMPNVLLEALLMEIPVIATDVGGTSEIIIDDQTGNLIPPGDVRILVDKILDFLKDPNKYERFIFPGKNHIQSNFNMIERTKKLSTLYEHLIQSKGEDNR